MKIIHVNTLCTGGAAEAVIRLHKGLLKAGVDSRLLFLKSRPAYRLNNVDTFIKEIPLPTTQRVIRKLIRYKSQQERQKQVLDKLSGHYECVSFPLTDYHVEDHPWMKEGDIIHLHWVANFINYPSFFRKVTKPIIWTLHDMNPFQGIFHYKNDLLENSAEFHALEVKYLKIKCDSLLNTRDLTIVTPSASLRDISIESKLFADFPHKVIPNGLDFDIFKPYNKMAARQVFNLPEDKIVFLYISENINNKRKGFDLLSQAIKPLRDDENIIICSAGKLNNGIEPENVLYVGAIHDNRLMALLYSAADAFILPSREDNLPNTMLEAMSCGLPVISFPVGGMKETITPFFNGLLAKDLSAKSLREELIQFLSQPERFDRQKIRSFAIDKFSIQKQAETYIRLYKEKLKDLT